MIGNPVVFIKRILIIIRTYIIVSSINEVIKHGFEAKNSISKS